MNSEPRRSSLLAVEVGEIWVASTLAEVYFSDPAPHWPKRTEILFILGHDESPHLLSEH